MSGSGGNSGTDGRILAYVERIERVQGEIDGLNGDKSDIFKELKGEGYDAKAVRTVLAIRRTDPATRQEHDAIVEMYLRDCGMA